jgi:peptidyl-prolyl cis-trans isomerase SurA
MTSLRRVFLSLLSIPLLCATSVVATAQNPFQIVLHVNEGVVTQYELEQRAKFLKLLGTPGDLDALALERLIEERLYLGEGQRLGVQATEEGVAQGMAEFAQRANLKTEEFIKELAKEDIDPQAFYDFVEAGIVWREVVGGLFGRRGQISDAEVDRALSGTAATGGVRVLLSEIILPADTPENKERAKGLGIEIQKITTQQMFSSAASQVSAAPSRDSGGRLDWLSLSDLPASFAPALLTLAPGEISEPIDIPNAVLYFQMRGLQETAPTEPADLAVEYARLLLTGGLAAETLKEARDLRYNADTCDDLYGLYPDRPIEQLEIISQAKSDVPSDIALELAKLDLGEISANLTTNQGQSLVVLMLCNRTAALTEDDAREELRRSLSNQRIGAYGDAHLAELRATAVIREP